MLGSICSILGIFCTILAFFCSILRFRLARFSYSLFSLSLMCRKWYQSILPYIAISKRVVIAYLNFFLPLRSLYWLIRGPTLQNKKKIWILFVDSRIHPYGPRSVSRSILGSILLDSRIDIARFSDLYCSILVVMIHIAWQVQINKKNLFFFSTQQYYIGPSKTILVFEQCMDFWAHSTSVRSNIFEKNIGKWRGPIYSKSPANTERKIKEEAKGGAMTCWGHVPVTSVPPRITHDSCLLIFLFLLGSPNEVSPGPQRVSPSLYCQYCIAQYCNIWKVRVTLENDMDLVYLNIPFQCIE